MNITIECLVQGSETTPYTVQFLRFGDSVKASCTCKAGRNRQLCKHRLAILDGDLKAVVSENLEEVADVATWIAGSQLAPIIAEVNRLEIEKRAIEQKLKSSKRRLTEALLP